MAVFSMAVKVFPHILHTLGFESELPHVWFPASNCIPFPRIFASGILNIFMKPFW